MRNSEHTPLLTCLLEGPPGAGKTALAATVGLESEYPFVKIISSDNMVGYSEQAKANQIAKVFEDAYRVGRLGFEPMPFDSTFTPCPPSDQSHVA